MKQRWKKTDYESRTLILRLRIDDYFFPQIAEIYNIHSFYRKLNLLENILLEKRGKLYCLTGAALDPKWKNSISEVEFIIVFDTGYTKAIGRYIKRHNPDCRLVMYFHNSIMYQYQRELLKDKNIDEFWSFDPNDSLKYGLNYNSTFYIRDKDKRKYNIIYDIAFVGRDKNRAGIIKQIEEEIDRQGLAAWIYLVRDEKETILYDDYIKVVKKSRAILDITQKGQSGLSLRFMEGLFLKKKIVTNNAKIKDYDFYKPDNIFVLGEDDISRLKGFLYSSYVDCDDAIMSHYTVDSWLKRFRYEKK